MGKSSDDFFEGKRPWSKIKDEVLKDYMNSYLPKVNTLRQPILLIDGYAGPGVFKDDTIGSPIIMCEAAEKYVKGNYHAIFINKEKKYHDILCSEIQKRGWSNRIQPLLGDSQILLQILPQRLKSHTVFLYLDPFGPTGCNFTLLKPFLTRNPRFSTEIVLTLNMPGMPRLAARHAVKRGRQEEETIKSNHLLLTEIFGGDYWKEILLEQNGTSKDREMRLIEAYRAKLAEYLPYTGFCPVREQTRKRIKYFIVFASRHPDALTLLNDAMIRAYSKAMHQADFADGLWKTVDWQTMRSLGELDRIIIDSIAKYPGESRNSIWFRIAQNYFMAFLYKEYIETIRRLVNEKKITFISKTGRLNEDSQLFLAQTQPPSKGASYLIEPM